MCWETAALNSREGTEAPLCSTPKSSAGPTEISKVGDAEGSKPERKCTLVRALADQLAV